MAALKLVAALAILATGTAVAQPERPIKRPPNNQLALEGPDAPAGRTDSPSSVTGITSQLVFHVSPLSTKGLLSQQIEDAIKALDKANGAATFLKLRAFIAGPGDLRRVQSIVNGLFTERKLPLPAITTVQVGSLPLEGAQVVIESISEERKPVNPSGLAFLPAIEAATGADAIAAFSGSNLLRLTCFADSLAEAESARAAAAKAFPKLTGVFVQSTRYTLGTKVTCEAVAQGGPVQSPKLTFSAAQINFGEQDADIAKALERIPANATLVNTYATSKAVAEKSRAHSKSATSAVFIEGLPSQDATLAVEFVQ